MTETWLPIPGYDGRYSVSDHGRVRSERRAVTNGNSSRTVPEMVLRPYVRNGYSMVQLSVGDKGKHHLIHRLVLLAFVGECPEGMEVRHLDGVRSNNRLANLAYGTKSENQRDRIRHGTSPANLTHCHKGHAFDEANTYVRRTGARMCRACMKEVNARANDKRRAQRTALAALAGMKDSPKGLTDDH